MKASNVNNTVMDALKQATILFVSIPFLTITAMAAPGRRTKEPELRMTKTGKRISQPGLRLKNPEKRLLKPKVKQNEPGLRADPGKRIGKTGVRFIPKPGAGNPGSSNIKAPVLKVQ